MKASPAYSSGEGDDLPVRTDRSVRLRRAATQLIYLVVVFLVAMSALRWWQRREFLASVDCQTLGKWDCAFDENAAAVIGALVGVPFFAVAVAGRVIAQRWPRAGLTVTGVAAVAWLLAAAVYLSLPE